MIAVSLRRAAALVSAVGAVLLTSLVLAGPASAAVPEGWSDPDAVDPWHALLVIIGLPLLGALILAILVYAPAVARGQRIAPGAGATDNAWLGGPRKTTAELAAPDTDDSQAGGASARW